MLCTLHECASHTLSYQNQCSSLKMETLFCPPWVGFLEISLARFLFQSILKKFQHFALCFYHHVFQKILYISNLSLLLYSSMLNKGNARDAYKSSWGPFEICSGLSLVCRIKGNNISYRKLALNFNWKSTKCI